MCLTHHFVSLTFLTVLGHTGSVSAVGGPALVVTDPRYAYLTHCYIIILCLQDSLF